VLEVVASEVGLTGGKSLRFYLVAHIRVVRVSDDSQLYQREFVYQSDPYPARLWGENQAALFDEELQRAYASLADSVVEQVFLLTPLPLESRARASGGAGLKDLLGGRDACGLAWVSPGRDYHLGRLDMLHPEKNLHPDMNHFPSVASRQPTLVWESFPREEDRVAKDKAGLTGISNVRYDLRLWEVPTDAPPRMIYQRRDLPSPSHTLEQPLAPQSRYFWSARARFDLAGREHGTKWGYFRTPYYALDSSEGSIKPELSPEVVVAPFIPGAVPMRDPCSLDFIPTSNYYRFQTP
jgi:hypothetical protein